MYSLVCLCFFSIVSITTAYNTFTVQDNTCANVTVLLSNLKFVLFTHKEPTTGTALNESTFSILTNTKDPTTLIIHGLFQNHTNPWVLLMKDTYLKKMPANIILVDWSRYSSSLNLAEPACAVPQVGVFVGDLLHNLTNVGVNVDTIQMNGFSYGAHVAGAAGQRIFKLTNTKVKRINGLEAGNQQFSDKTIHERLDANDAKFVQAIHTNSNGFGYGKSYGTIDFYVGFNAGRCGTIQLGCPGIPGVPDDGTMLPFIFCNHVRVIAYYIESINSDKFLGVQCGNCSDYGMGKCNSNPKTIMGEMCPFDQSGMRYLNTTAMPPFAQG